MFTNIASNQPKTVIRRALKRFLTGYYTIFLTFLLSANLFLLASHLITTPVNAQSQGQFFELDFNSMASGTNSTAPYIFNVGGGAYQHRIDADTKSTFTEGVTNVSAPKILLPVPDVVRISLEDPKTQANSTRIKNSIYLDDPYPDAVFVNINTKISGNPVSSNATINFSEYQKKCASNEASVFYYMSLFSLIDINKSVYSTNNSLVDSKEDGKDSIGNKKYIYFKSSKLSGKPLDQKMLVEYCYSTQIKANNLYSTNPKDILLIGYSGQQVVNLNGVPSYSRVVLGGADNTITQVFPKDFTDNKKNFTARAGLNTGTGLSDARFGNLYEFNSSTATQLSTCPLLNNVRALSTDLYGNPIKGVNTALGCLPGSFEGIFAVILRITIGMSSAILLLLLIGNGLTIVQSNNSPDKIKVAVSNITRGIAALLIIIFSVFILNLFGIKILALDSLGDVGIQQTLGN